MARQSIAALAWALSLVAGCSSSSGEVVETGAAFAGPITIARTYQVTPPGGAAFIQTDEVDLYSPPGVTRTVRSSNASAYQERSFTIDASTVVLNSITTIDGAPVSVLTYSPPQLILPSSAAPGTTASSTSTVTGGATPFTLVRSVTVDGIESVTVPAGTFSALRTTAHLTPSVGTATVSVDWWAKSVGRVRSITYPAATPATTTVMELLRTSPMVCSAGACACNALVNTTPPVPEVQTTNVAADLPAPAGGTIVDGTYYLTAENVYTGPGGASGPTGVTVANVVVIQGGTVQFASRRSGAEVGEERGTLGYEVSGAELLLTPLCGLGPGQAESNGFTATGNVLRLIEPPPAGTLEPGKEAVLTRQ